MGQQPNTQIKNSFTFRISLKSLEPRANEAIKETHSNFLFLISYFVSNAIEWKCVFVLNKDIIDNNNNLHK